MKNNILKNKFIIIMLISFLLAALCILGSVFSFVFLSQTISFILAGFISLGWVVVGVFIILLLRSYTSNKILNEAVIILDNSNKKAKERLTVLSKYIYGHHEHIDESIPFYRKVSEQSYPLANILGSFALSTKTTDTIILARWEHDENACFYHIGGSPIHEEQLIYILDQIKYHSLKEVSEEGIVWKKEELEH